jgi:hypothetical protein
MTKLNTSKLTDAAKLHTTDNEILKGVYGAVQTYNTMETLPKQEKVYLLERILVGCGEWLTSHRPKTTPTNNARWAALDDLAKQVIGEGDQLGARFLTGPTDWKTIGSPQNQRSYWLEYLSPQHGVGYTLSGAFERWRNGDGDPADGFWDYVQMNPPYGLTLVKYYGGTAKGEKRRVVFKAGQLVRASDDSPFHTQLLSTAVSGQGWAIFVVSFEGAMYAHKHEVGVFHHSTFLSGSAVMAAGELCCDGGVVKCITAKSGHYMPSKENLAAFVRHFPMLPRKAVIIPDFAANPLPAYTVQEFRFNSSGAAPSLKRAQVDAALPPWAKGGLTNMMNKIAA